MSSMTARDRAILSSLADWDPPADIVAAREVLGTPCRGTQPPPPGCRCLSRAGPSGPRPPRRYRGAARRAAISSRSLPARRRLGVRQSEEFSQGRHELRRCGLSCRQPRLSACSGASLPGGTRRHSDGYGVDRSQRRFVRGRCESGCNRRGFRRGQPCACSRAWRHRPDAAAGFGVAVALRCLRFACRAPTREPSSRTGASGHELYRLRGDVGSVDQSAVGAPSGIATAVLASGGQRRSFRRRRSPRTCRGVAASRGALRAADRRWHAAWFPAAVPA